MIALDDFAAFLEGKRDEIIANIKKRAMVVAATELKGEMIERIHGEGKASDGSQIGTYSRKPGYYSKEQFVRASRGSGVKGFQPQGNHGDKKFTAGKKKGQSHMSMFLKEGYYEFKGVQGKQNAFVDAKLSGSLQLSINVYDGENDSQLIAIADERESIKRKAVEKKFGKNIFIPGPSDIAVFNAAMDAEIEAIKQDL